MTWLAVLKLLLSLAASVLAYVQQRKLMEAGEAKHIAKSLEASLEILQRVKKAGDDASKRFDDAGGMPDDPNRRD